MISDSRDEQYLREQIALYVSALDPEVLGLAAQPSPDEMSVTRLAAGESNIQYLVKVDTQQYVVRIGLRRGHRHEALKEFTLLQAAAPLAIGPRPYYFDASCQHFASDVTIMEWIEGSHLSQHELHSQATLRELAELLARLHCNDLIRSTLEPYCAVLADRPDYRSAATAELLAWAEVNYRRLVQYRRKYGLADNRLMGKLREALQRERQRIDDAPSLDGSAMVPTHGDVHLGNILRQPDGHLRLIDWETASIQDPAFEFISLFTWEDFSLEEEQYLLDSYQASTGVQSLHERIGIYQAVYLLGVVLDTAVRAYMLVEGEIQSNLTIGRSLGFYQRDFFICFRNYLNWYTLERYTLPRELHKLGRITPKSWMVADPAEFISSDQSNDHRDSGDESLNSEGS